MKADRRKVDRIRKTRKILGKLLEEATEIRGPFWREIFGCVEDRIEIARKRGDQAVFKGQRGDNFEKRDRRIDRGRTLCSQELGFRSFSAAFGKSSQAPAADELPESEEMRGLNETVDVL
jgi:hypothetical protein